MTVLGLATSAAAQSPDARPAEGRRTTLVHVVDAAGKPIAGATVTCVGAALALDPWQGATDHVSAVSDAKGNASAALLPWLGYALWAASPAAADGVCQLSIPDAWYGAGGRIEMACVERSRTVRFAITGLDAWREFEPQVMVTVPFPGFGSRRLEADADGRWILPPLPSPWLEVRSVRGELLWRTSCEGAANPVVDVEMPRPVNLPLRAEDEQHRPVAGASIRLRDTPLPFQAFDGLPFAVRPGWREIGITGADGAATAVIPHTEDQRRGPAEALFEFYAPGYARAYSGSNYVNRIEGDRVVGGAPTVVVGVLRPPARLQGRIVGAVAPGLRAQLRTPFPLELGTYGSWLDHRAYSTGIGEDGSYRFDDVPTVVREGWLVLLPPHARPSPARVPVIAPVANAVVPEKVDTAAAARISVQAFDSQRGPAAAFAGWLHPLIDDLRMSAFATTRVFGDHRGQLELCVGPGRWLLCARAAEGWAYAVIDAAAGDQKVQLALAPPRLVEARVVDMRSLPVVDVQLEVNSVVFAESATPIPDIAVRFVNQWTRHIVERQRTDAEGRIQVPFFAEGSIVNLVVTRGERRGPPTAMTADEPFVIRLR